MRAWPLALLALMILPLGAAQAPGEFDFSEDYLARLAYGDIATTGAQEPEGAWAIAEYRRVTHDGNETRVPIASSQGSVVDVVCTCNQTALDGGAITIPATEPAGTYTVGLVRSLGEGDAAAFDLALFSGQGSARIVAYVPHGKEVLTDAELLGSVGDCTAAPCTIEEYAPAGGAWIAIVPAQDGTVVPGVPDRGIDVMWLAIGVLAGILLWALLVQRGVVQKRRRQEVQKAAHVEAAGEGKETLAARKQVLMAGLKQLEVAKMNKEIDTAVYEKLKAELKRETVTVMRALEAAR